ncbi:hypothetical protein PPYR_07654 [Photinus pyralis]|uniref:BHLH domain-containing protein n=2 Tax=Photinus pyralis TaxID=7054 RepID=A0A5N4AR13_PHOPY|nr:uncharacterized protein LOC116168448 [Photinus pyralis]XP_031340142.1 uncharacterized protein LOC116168448 [Photinus pyralis]KAB0799774.1 hypothetical protein PPYR_07654 [Photinus pyralis]
MSSEIQCKSSTIVTKSDRAHISVTVDKTRKRTKCGVKELIALRTLPPPAVARRNARERNRVKQVNNGFANLRQHIPNHIAAAFESNSGKTGNKKLSKVETLRMAVEYIRSLEKLLSAGDHLPRDLATSVTYPSSTSSLDGMSYSNSLASPSSEDDNLSNSTPTPPPLQYIRIIGSDTYHILPAHLLDTDRLKLLKLDDALLTNTCFINDEFKKVSTATEIAPEMYGGDNSLSPDVDAFIPAFNMDELSQQDIKEEKESIKSSEEMRILCRNLIMLQADADRKAKNQTLNVNQLMTW